MNAERFFRNPHFREYLRLLRNLHESIRTGSDESDDGEAIRDQMDAPADFFTKSETESANGISADLYSISNSEPYTPQPMTQIVQAEIKKALDARNAGEFIESLNLLRKNQTYVDFAMLTYVRGSVMFDAGEFNLAVDFFRHAMVLSPNNTNYTYMWLESLSRSDSRKASDEAKKILLVAAVQSPKLVLKAAEIRLSSTSQLSESQAEPIIRQLILAFEDTIIRLQTSGDSQDSPSLLASAFMFLGFCHEHLKNDSGALQSFDQGIKLFPNNDALLTARGIRRYAFDTARAIEDLRNAIALRSKLVWPYFFMAHHHLINDQFEECLQIANRALHLATGDSIRSECLEWIAICQASLGHPTEIVRASFNAARRLAPTNDRIETNRQRFEDSLSSVTPISWDRPDSTAAQNFAPREFQAA